MAWSWAELDRERTERKVPSEARANPEYPAISEALKGSVYGKICNAPKKEPPSAIESGPRRGGV